MKNINWARWIYTSIVKHFVEVSIQHQIPLYLGNYSGDVDWAELRFNGPEVDEPSHHYYMLHSNVDIMVTCFLGTDRYKIHKLTGIYHAAFTTICAYRYGDGPDDDHGYLGELRLADGVINTTNFGIIYPDNKFERATVEADYLMCLS